LKKGEEVKRRERERESTTTRNLLIEIFYVSKVFEEDEIFRTKRRLFSLQKSHARPTLCASATLCLLRSLAKNNNINDREDERRRGTPGRLGVLSLSLWCRRRKAFPLSFLPFFPANFLSLTLSVLLYIEEYNYSERKVAEDHELEINDDVAQTGKRRRRIRKQRPREEEHR
jgi:hypothetical protein